MFQTWCSLNVFRELKDMHESGCHDSRSELLDFLFLSETTSPITSLKFVFYLFLAENPLWKTILAHYDGYTVFILMSSEV